MAAISSADDVTPDHVTGSENRGENHNHQNSVRFKATSPPPSTPTDPAFPFPNSDPYDVTVSIPMEPNGGGSLNQSDPGTGDVEKTRSDHELSEVVSQNHPHRTSEGDKAEVEEPRCFMEKSDLEETLIRIRQYFLQFLDKNERISEEAFKAALGRKAVMGHPNLSSYR
ncbi:hypothetical protein ElyMa_006427200 [Elysia marginata]|uniref:HTH La-type RNA-binding domain-containing protein n=1 Tax=Elysia marginata TaxID=1093978 RepID=A0AAV4HYT8_9GAST|nr:hypothetical protein ElyMa_006427200 [Elysia marginata]